MQYIYFKKEHNDNHDKSNTKKNIKETKFLICTVYTYWRTTSSNNALYKYWLHEKVTWENVTPRKPCWPSQSRGWYCFSRGDNFLCYPRVQSILIILYWMFIRYINIVYITFGFKAILAKWIFEFVSRIP